MTDDGIDVRQLVNNYNTGGANQPAVVLDATGGSSSYAFTNTRASAQTVTDHDGIYRQARNNELCWNGLRRSENLLSRAVTAPASEVLGGAITAAWSWVVTDSCTVSAASYGTFPDGKEYVEYTVSNASGAQRNPYFNVSGSVTSVAVVAGEKIACSAMLEVSAASGGAYLGFGVRTFTSGASGVATYSSAVSTAGTTLAYGEYATSTPMTLSGSTTALAYINVYLTIPNGGSITFRLHRYHAEKVQGASNQVVSNYVNAQTTYNAAVAGVQYLSTTNGNSVSSGVLVEAIGTAISNAWTGLSLPYSRINRKTYSEDMDAVGWTLTNATAPDDGTLGPDAVGQLQKFTDDGTNAAHTLYGAVDAAVTGTRWTVAFHVKAGDIYGFVLRVGSATDYGQAEFRFSDMTVVTSASLGTGTFRTAYIERVGLTDIYLVQVCATFSGAILGQATVFAASAAGTTSYAGTGKYCYIGFTDWTGHDNVGVYIPNKSTGTTTHNVNAPTATLPASFASNGNITIVARFKPFFHPPATWKQDFYDGVVIGSGSVNYLRSHYANSSLSTSAATKRLSSVGYDATQSWASFSRLQQLAVATGLRSNVLYYSVNGVATQTNANSGTAGQDATITLSDLNGLLQRVEIWPRAFSEAEYMSRSTP